MGNDDLLMELHCPIYLNFQLPTLYTKIFEFFYCSEYCQPTERGLRGLSHTFLIINAVIIFSTKRGCGFFPNVTLHNHQLVPWCPILTA